MSLTNLSSLTKIARIAQNKDGPELLTVPLDKVVSKAQVRKRFRDIKELAESLKSQGLQSPIIVSPANARGEYVIQKGERRWRAAKLAGFDHIDVIVNKKEQSTQQQVIGELVENIQRDDLTPMEIANALGELLESGVKQAELAKSLGKSTTYVSRHVALLKLPECLAELVSQEIIQDVATISALRSLFDEDPVECVRVCEKVKENNGITRQQAREVLNSYRERAAKAAKATEDVPADTQNDHDNGERAVATDNGSNLQEAVESSVTTGASEVSESSSEEDAKDVGQLPEKKESKPKAENPFIEPEPELDSPVQEPSQEKEGPWEKVPADSIEIKVTVLMSNEDIFPGRLLIDRIAKNEAEAWVMLEGQDGPVCVSTDSIQVQGIGKRHG